MLSVSWRCMLTMLTDEMICSLGCFRKTWVLGVTASVEDCPWVQICGNRLEVYGGSLYHPSTFLCTFMVLPLKHGCLATLEFGWVRSTGSVSTLARIETWTFSGAPLEQSSLRAGIITTFHPWRILSLEQCLARRWSSVFCGINACFSAQVVLG